MKNDINIISLTEDTDVCAHFETRECYLIHYAKIQDFVLLKKEKERGPRKD